MLKFVLVLFLFLYSNDLHAMSKKRGGQTPPSPTPAASVTPSPSIPPSPSPTASASPMPVSSKIVTLECDDSCTDAEVKEVPKIEALMNSTLASDCFADYFVNRSRIDLTQGFSGKAIVAILRKPISLTLSYYEDRNTRVDGFEDADDFTTINFNRTAMVANEFDLCDKASLGGHEMSHAKGFFHKGNRAGPNYYTVPYTVNHAFDGGDSDFGACCKQ